MIKYGRKLLSGVLAASMVFSSAATTMLATAAPVFADEVQESVAVTGITLSMDAISGKPGQMSQLSATVSPEDATDKTVFWTSSDESVVSLWGQDENYTFFTLNATGTATITATAGGVSASVPVTVLVDPASVTEVTVTPSEVTLDPGETAQLSAATTPAGVDIIWESTANSIASVDPQTGVVTAREAGTATIKAMVDGREGMYGTCTVTVNPQETGLSWIVEDGILYIYGEGEMESHDWEDDFPWYEERSNFSVVVVDEGVTIIGDNAFAYGSNIEEVYLPSTLTTIGECGFFYCTNLTTLYMTGDAPACPSWGQFSSCNKMTVYVPEGATGYDVAPWTNLNIVEYSDSVEYPAPVLCVDGEVLEPTEVIEDGYAYTDWMSNTTTGPLYMYTLPAGTTSVDIDFTENVLAYNYGSANSSDEDYICGWFTDYMTGESSGTFDVDNDENGEPDYIQVQTPYDSDWNTSILYGIGFVVEEAASDTCAIDISSIMRDTGKPSGMYTFENAIVTVQEDGTYLVRFHQYNANRNVIALTDDKEAAKAHAVDWYIGGGADGYWFTIPVASLDEPIYAVMSSESRIAAGNDFSNVIIITLDPESVTATDEAPAVAEDMNINPAVVASATHAIEISSIMRDTGKPSGMYTFEGAIVTEQEDGTYLARFHQYNANRNVIALTDDKDAAKAHAVDWYIGGGADGYWFTIPVASLEEPIYAVMSSESRIAAGNDFSNVIVITFDPESMTDTEEADAVAEDMNINPAVPPVPEEIVTPYTVTANNTGMFKVIDAYMTEADGTKTLYITLNGTGYHSLFKGTYEEAVATGDDEAQWINGVIREDETEFNGKYEFAIPVEDGDSYMQINARSFSKGTWYPRYIRIDQEAATLESGDYAETFDLAVTNCGDAQVVFAEMNVNAGPNSNNYLVTATVGLPGYVQAYVGTAQEAEAATEGFIDSAIGEFTIQAEKLITPGSPAVDTILEQPTAVSFKDADGNWAEYTLTISKANRTLTADYTAAPFSVDPAEITVNVGETFELGTVNGDPNASTYTYFWHNASDTSIVERVGNAFGVTKQYKAIAAGDVTIKVVWDEPYISSECIVHVVDPQPQATAIITQPEDFTGVIGDTASFCIEAEGTDLVYQWYYSKSGTKWTKSTATGSNTAAITLKVSSVNKENKYKCVVTGADGVTVTSETAAVVVPQAAVITENPASAIANKGETVSFKVVAEHAVSYQWYYSKDGQKWYKSSAAGADTAEISIKLSSSNAGNVYRCKVTGEDGAAVTSESACAALAQPAVITTQPVSTEAAIGESVTFTVEAEHAVSCQWYYSKDNGAKWYKSTAAGAGSASLTIKKSSSNQSNVYRCKVTGEDGKSIWTDTVAF